MAKKPDRKKQGLQERDSGKKYSATGRPRIQQAALYKTVMDRVRGNQLLSADSNPVICDLRTLGEPSAKLKAQLDLLFARERFVSDRMTISQTASHLGLPKTQIAEWVEHYGWTEEKQMRMERRTRHITSIKVANEAVVEARTDSLFSKCMYVAEDLLDDHINGEDGGRLSAGELKQIADTCKVSFEIRGAIRGSEKVGEKLNVNLTGELQHKMVEMIKTISVAPPEQLSAPQEGEREILVQDAEFEVRQ